MEREVGTRRRDNSRLIPAVSCSFAAPLLYLVGEESSFHFVGQSSIGKTTLLLAGGSVCGGGGIVSRGVVHWSRCAGHRPGVLGVLIPASDGKPQRPETIPAMGKKMRVYHFTSAIIGGLEYEREQVAAASEAA